MDRLTSEWCRAARKRLDWTRSDLFQASGVSVYQITRLEWGQSLTPEDELKLVAAFAVRGIASRWAL